MASEILTKNGTIIVVANSTHAPGSTAANNLGARTGTDDIDMDGVLDGVSRQSTKLDFGGGTNLWASEWEVTAAMEPTSAPTAGTTLDFYIGFSQSATVGQDNPANLSGADGVYQGYGADTASGTEALSLLIYIGSLVATADDAIFVGSIGTIAVPMRYGSLVIQNNLGVTMESDSIEMSVRFTPVIFEGQ